MFSFG
jgi:hypothetical protein